MHLYYLFTIRDGTMPSKLKYRRNSIIVRSYSTTVARYLKSSVMQVKYINRMFHECHYLNFVFTNCVEQER